MNSSYLLDQIQVYKSEHIGLNFYVIADAAQDEKLLNLFNQGGTKVHSKCLLADLGPDADKVSPHLVKMDQPELVSDVYRRVAQYAENFPKALTMIASTLSFGEIFKHLAYFTRVRLPDQSEMVLAYWDPAILGTLLGNHCDATLHVSGPVFTSKQRRTFLTPVVAWWYWDRTGKLQTIKNLDVGAWVDFADIQPLAEVQVDMLVEASVPDHVLNHIEQNQPTLLLEVPKAEQYGRIKQYLLEARQLGQNGMKDILNYISAGLVYGDQMNTNPQILELLKKVKLKQLSMGDALALFP